MTDDITSIKGIGPTIAESLRDAGFETAEDVKAADVETLADIPRLGESSARAILEGDGATRGRPSELEDNWDAIMDAAERGLTYEGIARVAGVGLSTLNDWRQDDEDFSEKLEQRRSYGELELVDDVREDNPEFILERSYDYIKTEKHEVDAEHEHTGEGGGPIEVTVNRERYEPDE